MSRVMWLSCVWGLGCAAPDRGLDAPNDPMAVALPVVTTVLRGEGLTAGVLEATPDGWSYRLRFLGYINDYQPVILDEDTCIAPQDARPTGELPTVNRYRHFPEVWVGSVGVNLLKRDLPFRDWDNSWKNARIYEGWVPASAAVPGAVVTLDGVSTGVMPEPVDNPTLIPGAGEVWAKLRWTPGSDAGGAIWVETQGEGAPEDGLLCYLTDDGEAMLPFPGDTFVGLWALRIDSRRFVVQSTPWWSTLRSARRVVVVDR